VGERDSAAESDALAQGAAALGIDLPADSARRLVAFLDLLYDWNASAGLTAIDRRDAVRLHLLDSLAIVPFLVGAGHIVDLGSGGGLPGIPIAVAMEEASVTLVDSKRRRCSFLRETVRQLGLSSRVSVLEADAKAGLPTLVASQDAVVARAFVPPRELVTVAAPLLVRGGRLALMSGADDLSSLHDVATAVGLSLESARTFTLPLGAERRSLTLLRRL
jgi:16S rRNA (guanine527-N7)-methyltransferase